MRTFRMATADGVPTEEEIRERRIGVARRNPHWTEVDETALVPRGRFLVHADSDEWFGLHRGVIFPTGSAGSAFNEAVLSGSTSTARARLCRSSVTAASGRRSSRGRRAGGDEPQVIVKFAPVFTLDRFNDPRWTRLGRRMYYPGALKLFPWVTSVPLLADHGREIGVVHKLFTLDWTDGPWIAARATIEGEPPCWLARGRGASFGSKILDRRAVTIRGTTAEVIADALVEEVSVLIAKKPGEPRAEVLSVEREEPPAAREEVFYGGRTIVRHGIGQVLGVR